MRIQVSYTLSLKKNFIDHNIACFNIIIIWSNLNFSFNWSPCVLLYFYKHLLSQPASSHGLSLSHIGTIDISLPFPPQGLSPNRICNYSFTYWWISMPILSFHYSPKSVKGLRVHACIFVCAHKLSSGAKGAQCYLGTKSALTYLGGADSTSQVGSDSLLSCSIIYKFVTTNTFNCHNITAFIYYVYPPCERSK